MLQKKIKNAVQSFSVAGNNVYFDWGIVLGISCIVALILVSLSAGLFSSIYADGNTAGQLATTVTSSSPSSDILDTADLTNLISIFQSKNAQMSVFTVTYPGPSDPAVPLKFTAGSVSSVSVDVPAKPTNTTPSVKPSKASSTVKKLPAQ